MFGWFKATLASLVHLLALYHHYSVIVELVLELYCETAKRILCYFTAAESKFFYENSLALIRTYAERQGGKRTVDKEAEEEQYRDLLLLMELLTNLLSKVWLYKSVNILLCCIKQTELNPFPECCHKSKISHIQLLSLHPEMSYVHPGGSDHLNLIHCRPAWVNWLVFLRVENLLRAGCLD